MDAGPNHHDHDSEDYVVFNGGAPVQLFTLDPGGSPFGLFGGASRPVSVSTTMP